MSTPRLPPPPIQEKMDSPAWRDWFWRLHPLLLQFVAAASGLVSWITQIDFAGSNLTSIATRNHNDLQNIEGFGTHAWHFDTVTGKANFVGGVNAGATGTEWKQLIAGSNITISYAAGQITLSSSNPGGTVTSVGLAAPSIFAVSGSPVTTSGTLTFSLNTQSANMVFAGPTSGGAATPTFRALVAADIPAIAESQVTNLVADLAAKAPLAAAVATKTGAYTLVDGDFLIRADATSAAFSVKLPATVIARTFAVKKVDSSANVVTFDGNGNNIDGAATKALALQYDCYTVVGDVATNTWNIV